MRKLNIYLLGLIAFSVILSSCGDDETEPVELPAISISSTDFDETTGIATGQPGDMVSATITVTSDAGVNAVRVTKNGGETDANFPMELFTKTSGEDGPMSSGALSFEYTLLEAEVGVEVTFTVTGVEDTDEARTSTSTLEVETTSPDARVYTEILLAAPLGLPSTAETFFSTNVGDRFSPSDVTGTSDAVSGDIDFGYFEGSTSGANLASPLFFDESTNAGLMAQTNNWGITNDITFRSTTLDTEGFLGVLTFADIDAAFEAGTELTDPSNISNLQIGDVVAFETDPDKTDGSRRGVLQVTDITPGTGVTGSIELEIVVQEDPQ